MSSSSTKSTHRIEGIIPYSQPKQPISNHQNDIVKANNSRYSDNNNNNIDNNNNNNNNIYSFSCFHLSELRSCVGPHPFKNLQGLLQVSPLGRACVFKDRPSRCGARLHAPSRLYACIACAAVSCHLHAPVHASDSAHAIAVDVDRAELFCCLCNDQAYDKEFDAEVVLAAAAGSVTGPTIPPESVQNLRKRRRVEYRPWTPDPRERALIIENSSPLPSQLGDDSASDSPALPPWGLRGLNNLGNTCFMNSVLQALLHTPPFRNYFLSDKHNRYFCQRKNDKSSNANANANKFCLACDLDAMFSAMFSGDRAPYSPAKFLYSWWQHASNLASYEQQDAHEFFISILDGIHEKMQKDKRKPQGQGRGDCCIAHKVFSGILRSDLMCTACGFTSTTYDPCVDISLDLEPNLGRSNKSAKSHHSNGEADSINSSQNNGISTLKGCLDRFTRPERLGSDQKFFCQQCQVRQESLKQMSIRKLPLVSCFHIKRFEHSPFRKMSRKIDRYLQFPFSLDMAPYLSSSILKSRFGNRMFSFDRDESDPPNDVCSEFELFAVITHSGKLDAGHYVTYLRLSNQWYKCDDAWITQVSDNIVRASQGYMMFYVQKMLYYKVSERSVAS